MPALTSDTLMHKCAKHSWRLLTGEFPNNKSSLGSPIDGAQYRVLHMLGNEPCEA